MFKSLRTRVLKNCLRDTRRNTKMKHEQAIIRLNEKIKESQQLIKEYDKLNDGSYQAPIDYHIRLIAYYKQRIRLLAKEL